MVTEIEAEKMVSDAIERSERKFYDMIVLEALKRRIKALKVDTHPAFMSSVKIMPDELGKLFGVDIHEYPDAWVSLQSFLTENGIELKYVGLRIQLSMPDDKPIRPKPDDKKHFNDAATC